MPQGTTYPAVTFQVISGSPVPAMLGSAFSCLLSAIGMAVIVSWFGIESAIGGGLIGAFAGVTLVATAMLSDSLFSGSGWRLYCIQAGYRVSYLMVIGAILGGWPA